MCTSICMRVLLSSVLDNAQPVSYGAHADPERGLRLTGTCECEKVPMSVRELHALQSKQWFSKHGPSRWGRVEHVCPLLSLLDAGGRLVEASPVFHVSYCTLYCRV